MRIKYLLPMALASVLTSQVDAITGTVTDESGQPIAGAYVGLKQAGNHTWTDNQGNYSINESTSIRALDFRESGAQDVFAIYQQSQLQLELSAGSYQVVMFNTQGQLIQRSRFQMDRADTKILEVPESHGQQATFVKVIALGATPKANQKANQAPRQALNSSQADTLYIGAVGYHSQEQAVVDMQGVEDFVLLAKSVVQREDNWGFITHDNGALPDYETLFPDGAVQSLHISIESAYWLQLLEDMAHRYGDLRSYYDMDPNQPTVVAKDYTSEEPDHPIYRPAKVEFNGHIWEDVGFRFKGNSTLGGSWTMSPFKVPFKLDFDEFEDLYPQIDNQRIYGVKQIGFANNNMDFTGIRERLAGEWFKSWGVPVPERTYFKVYVDFDGSGSLDEQYFGVYTGVEAPGKAMLKTWFGNDEGNLYKPEPPGGQINRDPGQFKITGTLNDVSFKKKNNKLSSDWSDVQEMREALHQSNRTSNPAQWRADLEAVFNVEAFLKFQATNTLMNCGDTYGGAPHNFYFYHNQDTDQFEWIAYDLNNCMDIASGVMAIDKSDVNFTEWPLIGFLMQDAVYEAKYYTYLREAVDSPEWTNRATTIAELKSLIEADIKSEEPNYSLYWPDFSTGGPGVNPTAIDFSYFDSSIEEMLDILDDRDSAARAMLTQKGF